MNVASSNGRKGWVLCVRSITARPMDSRNSCAEASAKSQTVSGLSLIQRQGRDLRTVQNEFELLAAKSFANRAYSGFCKSPT